MEAASTEVAQELFTELEEEVYHELEDFVADPKFVAALEKPTRHGLLGRLTSGWRTGGQNSKAAELVTSQRTELASSSGVEQPEAAEEAETALSGPGLDASPDNFVVIEKKDVVESMAFYIAASIVELPEAQALTPKQLQSALLDALRVLKRSRFQRVCNWGKRMYRWGTYTYSAVQMYQNPWLMRAVLAALWATSRVSYRLLL